MVDAPMLPQRGRAVLVVLQDGRQLEGERIVLCCPLSGCHDHASVDASSTPRLLP